MDSPGSPAETASRVAAAIQAAHARIDELEREAREPIAIIGMACRMPGGADDPDALWSLLSTGVDAVTPIPPERVELARSLGDTGFDDPAMRESTHGAFVDRVDAFEPAFFGISEREAMRMDPQQRMLLEVSWQALENAAISPAAIRGSRTGLYVGICFEDFAHRRTPDQIDVALSVGSSRSLAVGRVAYNLDLHGPVMQLDTTCSSSLLAVHLAGHALRRGECDLALAGGVNLMLAHEVFLAFQRMGALSRTGRCRAFDAAADGYVRGEGCGLVVLKRLSAAVADGDHIWAVIEGTAVNHDGRSNGLTAPNGTAQEAVIKDALANARLAPADVQYLEAHGTGTPLGDPIELGAAMRVLGEGRSADHPLYAGSIKSNMGHLEGAAGVAGLMKAALSLHHGRIPAQQHFEQPNERIAWDTVPVRVPTATIDWPEPAPGATPHAGISSFGMSGTNVHVVLGRAPKRAAPEAARIVRLGHVLVLSARSDASLQGVAARYADVIERSGSGGGSGGGGAGGASIGDACFTANTTRDGFAQRVAFIAHDASTLAGSLRAFAAGGKPQACVVGTDQGTPQVAFEFTDTDVAWANVAQALRTQEPAFREAFDRCMDEARAVIAVPPADAVLSDAAYLDSHAALVSLGMQVALAGLWRSWGITPAHRSAVGIGRWASAIDAETVGLGDAVAALSASVDAEPPTGAAAPIDDDVVRLIMGPSAPAGSDEGALGSIGPASRPSADAMLRVIAEMAVRGVAVDWSRYYAGCGDQRVPLPPYSFDRKRLWLDPVPLPEPRIAVREMSDRAAAIAAPANAKPVTSPNGAPSDMGQLLLVSLAEATDRAVEDIDPTVPLSELDLDSLAAADLLLTLERELGRPLSDDLLAENPTLAELGRSIEKLMAEGTVEADRSA